MDSPHLAYSWSKAIINSIAIALNSVLILSNARVLRELPHTSVIIFTLCCSDCLTMINGWILTTTHLIRNSLEYDKKICQIHGAMVVGGALVSMSLCAGLTLLRYKVTSKPKKSQTYSLRPIYRCQLLCLLL
ncbi:hypothetical protein BJ741DRAFT_245398 [Chytriomyces cf. hyalinus JEL632]|nr:hypothetical protein BJ741DRAFT_245398 [Chytriomyces cf. hyalinus JEL632]